MLPEATQTGHNDAERGVSQSKGLAVAEFLHLETR
jgi:hypothetical protein